MAAQSASERRTEQLDFRVSPSAKARLQAAASFANGSVSDFILESALARADEALADRRLFLLDAEPWEAFQVALDAPPRSMPAMKELLAELGSGRVLGALSCAMRWFGPFRQRTSPVSGHGWSTRKTMPPDATTGNSKSCPALRIHSTSAPC